MEGAARGPGAVPAHPHVVLTGTSSAGLPDPWWSGRGRAPRWRRPASRSGADRAGRRPAGPM